VFEAVLLDDARAAYERLDPNDQADVDRILHLLELSPWTDGVTRFTAVIGDVGMGVYDDDHWEVVYRVVDLRFIEVVGITRIES
jgi:hypothetical protein